jgi:ribose transport system ATP-binding protein
MFQEFSVVPALIVEQTLFLGREMTRDGVLDRPAMRGRAVELIKLLGFDPDPGHKVRELSRARQQKKLRSPRRSWPMCGC